MIKLNKTQQIVALVIYVVAMGGILAATGYAQHKIVKKYENSVEE